MQVNYSKTAPRIHLKLLEQKMKLSGACHCGQVTYQTNGEPVRMAHCHCNACRRTTGTGHNVQAFFKSENVKISGETKTHESVSDSGNIRTRHFCSNCGSRLFSENAAMPDITGIAVGSFNDSTWFKPQIILYNAERPEWDKIDQNIKTHDLM